MASAWASFPLPLRPMLLFWLVTLALLLTPAAPSHGNLPSIFILGAQKGGSSSLFEFLLEHPTLCKGDHKEPHFFDDWKVYGWKNGVIPDKRAYTELFPGDPECTKKNVYYRYIDATTMLASTPLISKWMFDFYRPDERAGLRFIAVLRDPVARDYSWYQQVCRDQLGGNPQQRSGGGERPLPFSAIQTMKEADAHKARHIKRSGRYAEQLGNLTQYFRRDQLFVVSSRMLFQNTSLVMGALSRFLGLDKVPQWDSALPHDSHLDRKQWADIVQCIVSHIPALDCSFRQELADYYAPFNAQLYAWLNHTRHEASPHEPPFLPFGDDWRGMKCVEDARGEYDRLIAGDPGGACQRQGGQREREREERRLPGLRGGEGEGARELEEAW